MSRTVRAVILAGGETKNPLTRHRAMPAVPLGSSLLMVDVPLNNCLQAGINKIYVLTQFQSHTLNSHIAASYPPLKFGAPDQQAWVDVLAAQQTVTEREWYLGSADAVRKNIGELKDEARGITPARDYVILSGAAVYDMDFQQMVAFHRAKNADVTIAMHTVPECDARSKGIAQVHSSSCKVLKFVEKPAADDLPSLRRDPSKEEPGSEFLANMGIYVFKREALFRLMDRPQLVHIGHHVIPNALAQEMKVYAFQHDGYWHDVSSLKDFFETNLDLADPDALMGMIDNMRARRATFLPPSIMHDVDLDRVIVGDGCVLNGCKISNSVLGQSMYVGRGTRIESSLLLGNGAWLSDSQRAEAIENGQRVYGIGENCFLRRCVVDENASIGNNVQIINKSGVKEADRAADSGFMIQDGIVVIMRNAEIPDGVVI
ncbi:glucose-1-phosphate adenylyltransferase [Chlorella sorokiniana]|uniref:glucose-1-phosphate adenylyltransferase n=1 Tax=Chlorella sorokiniana TaxID=3076 RepID=A0A2P6TKT0_CHLSO|nr:glucose-1-phosphate adenylyltransferase [Chlorella sorokiniana]|eukprot:PRW44900.1 glucose-1-phosphate adenylyltransferase [Chlorella sorokiniana]